MKNNNYPNWLVPIEIAKELKEIGFDTPCSFYYDELLLKISPYHDEEFSTTNWNDKLFRYCVSLPTWEQVFEWFREKKIYGNVNQEWEYGRYNSPIGLNYFYVINDCRKKKINKTKAIVNGGFDNYEEAREELVIKIIRTYKNEQL